MCDKVKLEALRERGKEEQSARRISRYARNDGMGMDGSPYAPCLIIIPLIEFIYAFFARFL